MRRIKEFDLTAADGGERLHFRGVVVMLLATAVAVMFMRGVGADTSGTPDTNTKAAVSPTTPNLDPPGPISGAAEGTAVNIHVDSNGNGPTFFGVNAARLCKTGLNIQSSSQMSPSQFGNCIAHPFVTGSDDDFMQVSASPQNTSVDFTFRVGSGTQTFTKSDGTDATITCDTSNPCAIWLWESVDPAVKSSGNLFKHFDVNYGAAVTTTTTVASTTSTTAGTTTSTTAGGTTTSTTTGGVTTTTAPITTTTTAPATTTTTHAVTTTTAGPATTTTTHAVTTTTAAPATTTTTHAVTTTTAAPAVTTTTPVSGATTTSTAGSGGSTTTTTSPPGVSVSPSTVTPGGTITVSSSGWQGTVNVVLHSDPVTLGTLTANSSGNVSGQFTIPADIAAGVHTIELTGTGSNGAARSVSVSFTVTAAAAATTTPTTPIPVTGRPISHSFRVGLFLVACGGALVVVARRRSRSVG